MTKVENFSDIELRQLADKFKILSEASRLKILRSLFVGEKCVTEIVKDTGMMQANVSKQLGMLQNGGILKCRQVGLQRFYSLTDDTIIKICKILCQH